jgi:hypothetical protein
VAVTLCHPHCCRAIAMTIAALVMVTLAAGCSGGSSKPTLAEQDRIVELANQLDAARARYAAEQRALAQARREVARLRAATVVETRSGPHGSAAGTKTGKSNASFDSLCGPLPPVTTAAQRRAQKLLLRRRKQALYFLNLSCPAEGA